MTDDIIRKGENTQRIYLKMEAEIGVTATAKESLEQQTLEKPRKDSSLAPSEGAWPH